MARTQHKAGAPTRAQRNLSARQRGKSAPPRSKLDHMVAALRAPKGATISDLMELTGWQAHSVRGALAGSLKRRGLSISSTKTGPERVYRIGVGR